jgi:putative resolvase
MKTIKTYAREHGIKYKAAWNRFNLGKIPGAIKDEFGRILIPEDVPNKDIKVVCYARVSSSENKKNLDSQADRILGYANATGLPVCSVVKEIGSGMNDSRKKLLSVLLDPDITHIVVEHKDRLTRFGFNYIKSWMSDRGVKIVVINEVDNDRDDLMQDFVSMVTSFVARLYGLRRSRRRTEQLIKELKNVE